MTDEQAKKLQKLLLKELANGDTDFTSEEWDFMNDMYREYKAEYRQILRKAKALLSLNVATDEGVLKL